MHCKPHHWAWLMLLVPMVIGILYIASQTHDMDGLALGSAVLFGPYLLFALFAAGFAWRKSSSTIQKQFLAYPFAHTLIYVGISFLVSGALDGGADSNVYGMLRIIAGVVFAVSAVVAAFLWLISIVLLKTGWLVLQEP